MADEKRLIDANALKEKLQAHHDFFVNAWGGFSNLPLKDKARVDEITSCIADVVNAPTVDAVEAVHAEWLDIQFDPMWRSMLATCSHCKVRGEVRVKSNECGFAVPDSDYCPSCGAKMDGGTV